MPDVPKRNLDLSNKLKRPLQADLTLSKVELERIAKINKDLDLANKLKRPLQTDLTLSRAELEKVAEINPVFKKVLDGGVAEGDHIKVSFDKHFKEYNDKTILNGPIKPR